MKGKYYALNFPLRDGISDENYKSVFEPVSTLSEGLNYNAKGLSKGDPTSHGIIRSFSHCATMRYGFTLRRQIRMFEFVHAWYVHPTPSPHHIRISFSLPRTCQLCQIC